MKEYNVIVLQKFIGIIILIIVGIYCVSASVAHISSVVLQIPVFCIGIISFLRGVYLLKNSEH